MTTRTDITINHTVTPRLITVLAPSVELTVQDLVDTLRALEDDFACMSYAKIMDAAGKTQLRAGLLTGITITLRDAVVRFEERTTPVSAGSITTAGVLTLIDSAATFITDGVLQGDLVINHEDQSSGTIASVDSETQVTLESLTGGTENDFDLADVYNIYEFFECNILDGNLAAVDSGGTPIAPTVPTFGVQIIREADTSAAIRETGVSGLTPTESAQLDTAATQLPIINTNIADILQIDAGRWKIDTTTNQMTFYDSDGTTPIHTFDLKDAAGDPTSTNPFERVPV